MASVRVNFWGHFYFHLSLVFHDFEGFLIKTIIPLALVGYEMIVANSAPRWLFIISYPTSAGGVIVNYTQAIIRCTIVQWASYTIRDVAV